MTRKSFLTLLATACVTFAGPIGSAEAGIIVTVGDSGAEIGGRFGDRFKKADGDSASTPASGNRGATVAMNRTCRAPGTSKPRPCPQPRSPAVDGSGLPLEWQCRPIGNGVFYCDVPLHGSGVDAGAGGNMAGDVFTDEEELMVVGCGGGDATQVLWPLAVLGALAWRFRRRQPVQGARG